MPEDYAQTKINLLNTLRQLERLGRGRLSVEVIPTDPRTEEAALASQQFGIEPVSVLARVRGAYREEPIFLGCAITSGLEPGELVVTDGIDKLAPQAKVTVRGMAPPAESGSVSERRPPGAGGS